MAFSCSKPKKEFLIGFSQATMIDPWRVNMLEQMKIAVKKHLDEIEFVYTDGQNDNMKQIADVEDLLARGIDLLIISPRAAEPLTSPVKKVYDAGIPVITLDRNVVGDAYTCFIGASNLEIGREAGKLMAEKLNGNGKVIEIEGILGTTPTIERSQGFHEVVAQYPDIEIIERQAADYLRAPAMKLMEDFLQAHQQIDGIYAHNDEMALGALAAARAVGRDKGLIVIGIDGQREAINSIMDGEMIGTFIYPNGSVEAIETGLKILKGRKVPKKIPLKTTKVTKENAAKFYDPNSYF